MALTPRSYLDWNATTPLLPEALTAMLRAAETFGNPSSIHAEGRAARALIEAARTSVAALVGAEAKNVVFTASGTEAANAVLSPALGRAERLVGLGRLLMSAVEHPCVLAGGQFTPDAIERLAVDADGRLDLGVLQAALARAVSAGEPVLLSLQAGNNETGVIQPVQEAATLVHEAGGLVHVDAVQAAGKIAIDIAALGADVLTLSAHKVGGPKGAGAIVFSNDRLRLGTSLVKGGGQERGQRAGTEDVAAISGFGVAARIAVERLSRMEGVRRLRDQIEMGIRARAHDVIIFATSVLRLPNTTCFAVPGLAAETALIGFDMDGVAVSSGSACSSGKVKPSHVLEAMGVEASLARCAIRVSLGPATGEADVARFLAALENRLKTLHKTQGIAA